MNSRKILKRFLSDTKLSVSPIPDNKKYWERVFSIFPEFEGRYKNFLLEIAGNPEQTLNDWDAVRGKIIEDIKANPKYQSFIQSSMSEWKLKDMPEGGIPSKSIFELEAETLGGCYLSIDLKSANFQAIKEVGVYSDYDWESLISRYTSSEHLKKSKYFRSVVYGNLNVGRTQTVEKYLTNEIRRLLNDELILPENYKLLTMMPDELVYEIQYNDLDLDMTCRELEEFILERTGIMVKAEQFQLQHYYLQSKGNPGRKIKFFGKTNLEDKSEELCGLGVPYYLIGTVLWKGIDPIDEDLMFLNQEGYVCKLLDEFEIKRGI